jgi:hypothetical protein
VPAEDVVAPPLQGAGRAAEFGDGAVVEVVDEPVEPAGGEGRIGGEGVEVTQCPFAL